MAWFSFLPREARFFGLLHEGTANLTEVAVKLLDLMEHYEDVPEKVAEIKRLEHVGDEVIHEIMQSLHRTFVTPLDREDIAALGERIDDVVDTIEETARNMLEYGITVATEKAQEIARIILESAQQLEAAVSLLRYRGARLREILPYAVELNRLENEADQVASQAVAELFDNGLSASEVLKWREIYGHLEEATDFCEDAANVLEGIVLKNA